MDSKLLLVKIITLLFRESQLPDKSENSAELAKEIIATIKPPANVLDTDKGRETVLGLRTTALWMTNNSYLHTYDAAELLQRIRINVGDDQVLINALAEGLKEIDDPARIKILCINAIQELKNYVKQNKVRDIIRKASHDTLFASENIDWHTFVPELITMLEPFAAKIDEKIGSEVESLEFDNIDSLKGMLEIAAKEISPEGILRCGIQAINRMMGEHGGFMRGESWVIGALQHNFKTGFMMTLLRGFVRFNKAQDVLFNKEKKPLILVITLENSISTNILWLYQTFKEHDTGVECDVKGITVEEASEYLLQKFGENGFSVKMRRFNSSEFTFRDLINVMLKYESEGYEIIALLGDYWNTMSKEGCNKDTVGSDTRDLFRRIRNFTNPRKILNISPHQLSTEAKSLVRAGVNNFVGEIANKGYYDSCRTLDQEVDGELYIHIEKRSGVSNLTVQRGKHRKAGKLTPEEHLYTVLPFFDVGSIRDDLDGPDLSMKKLPSSGDLGW